MPDYNAPGVYVEENPFGPKPIVGLSTSAAGFVGPTHAGPAEGLPQLVTSLNEFERTFGDAQPMQFAGMTPMPNFLWYAVRAFLDNGGQRLYVARVFRPNTDSVDGDRPLAVDYEGIADDTGLVASGLHALARIDEVSIVAAPGAAYGMTGAFADEAEKIAGALIAHAEQTRYRIAVLDSGDAQSVAQVDAFRAKFNSSYAALYYPWVQVADAATGTALNVPPSGFIAGVYARTDHERGVWKAPAGVPLTSAVGLERQIDDSTTEALTQTGVNCLRHFPGRGYLVWGARLVSSDPEWKYVNVRRYFAYLEHSIDAGTRWAVFEPNGDQLWANVQQSIASFLFKEWKSGALQGLKPEQAYFVRCDRATMTQNDIDNGRLVAIVGVAAIKPAEFVIFRIGQWTADHTT